VKPIITESEIELDQLSTSVRKKVSFEQRPKKDQPEIDLSPVVSEEQKKQYQIAYKFFYDLFKKTPENQNLNFLLGKAAYGMCDYEAAVMAFERVLIIDPSAIEIKLEIAKSYAALKSYEIATQYIDEVLEADTPEDISIQAKNMLELILAVNTGD